MRSFRMTGTVAGLGLLLLLAACAGRAPSVAVVGAPAPLRYNAGFSCIFPQSPLQTLVCENATLASLDMEMSRSYHRLIGSLDLFGRGQLVADQRQWLLGRLRQCRIPSEQGGAAGDGQRDCL